MIRQTINCDICAAEKQSTSYWFVAYEQGGAITLRGWEAPKSSRRNPKHLCGQKCVQRMMSNFTAAVMSNGHGETRVESAVTEAAELAPVGVSVGRETAPVAREAASVAVRETAPMQFKQTTPVVVKELPQELPVTERIHHIDPELMAAVEAESWAGPVRPKENHLWDLPHKLKMERESFLHAARPKLGAPNRLQKSA
jgi:hypothetical protein